MVFATLLLSLLLGATISVASIQQGQLQAEFKEMDKNGDGCLSFKEHMTWMITQRDQGAIALPDNILRRIEEKSRPMMEEADQDGDGCLTLEEMSILF